MWKYFVSLDTLFRVFLSDSSYLILFFSDTKICLNCINRRLFVSFCMIIQTSHQDDNSHALASCSAFCKLLSPHYWAPAVHFLCLAWNVWTCGNLPGWPSCWPNGREHVPICSVPGVSWQHDSTLIPSDDPARQSSTGSSRGLDWASLGLQAC